MTQEKIDRINELARIARERGLTAEEQAERTALREEYIAAFRGNLEAQLKTITEANRKQGEDLTKKIGEMQGSITSLTEKNAQINRELSETSSRNSSLLAELDRAKAKGGNNVLTILLAVISAVLLIALLLK